MQASKKAILISTLTEKSSTNAFFSFNGVYQTKRVRNVVLRATQNKLDKLEVGKEYCVHISNTEEKENMLTGDLIRAKEMK